MKKKSINPQVISRYLKKTASLKLTVICLVLLAVLVVWGTLYQADHGLYQAQHKFFHSWIFFIWGFIPFPGTVLVMFVLFFNLVSAIYFRPGLRLRLVNLGNLVTHTGMMVLLLGGFFTFYFSQESVVILGEGETSNFSVSEKEWELSVTEKKGNIRDTYAVDTAGLKKGDNLLFPGLGLKLEVMEYYPNCRFGTPGNSSQSEPTTTQGAVITTNVPGVTAFQPVPVAQDASNNQPGIIFNIAGLSSRVLLYGAEDKPVSWSSAGRRFYVSLERKRFPLPLEITLIDFRVQHYPNSQIPRSFESKVQIAAPGGLEREVIIAMNKPLRYGDLAFFQSSYMVDDNGREHTILAVVQNAGRLLPYVASIWIFLGLLIHFVMKLKRRREQAPTKTSAPVTES